MANRILRWTVYTLIFALLPMLITLLYSVLFSISVHDYTTELLFFIVMICATSLNDIQEAKQYAGNDFVFNCFFSGFVLMIVTTSVLYGSTLLISMTSGFQDVATGNISMFAVILSVLSGAMGLVIQIILHRTEVLE